MNTPDYAGPTLADDLAHHYRAKYRAELAKRTLERNLALAAYACAIISAIYAAADGRPWWALTASVILALILGNVAHEHQRRLLRTRDKLDDLDEE